MPRQRDLARGEGTSARAPRDAPGGGWAHEAGREAPVGSHATIASGRPDQPEQAADEEHLQRRLGAHEVADPGRGDGIQQLRVD
eukprot:9257890-Pyramimonas_sp.AAC.1